MRKIGSMENDHQRESLVYFYVNDMYAQEMFTAVNIVPKVPT